VESIGLVQLHHVPLGAQLVLIVNVQMDKNVTTWLDPNVLQFLLDLK
jgi:hypothetical protein